MHRRYVITHRCRIALASIPGLVAFCLCAAALADERGSPAGARLAEHGLAPTTQSLSGYLASLHPTPERQKVLCQLIEQLGDEDFLRREEASRLLVRQVGGVRPLLAEAVAGDNPEIRWRAKVVLDQTDRESRSLLSAVFAAIRERKVPGLTAALFAVLPLADDNHLRLQLRPALAATAEARDVPFLRRQLASSDPQARLAAIATLSAVLGADADRDALPLLADASDEVQLAAARVLADHGRRESLPALVRLLDASRLETRGQAIQVLRAFTGQQFAYTAYDPDDRRTAAVVRWKEWLDRESASAALSFPLRESPLEIGRILVCDHGRNMLVELDTAGKKVWEKPVGVQPWACLGLASGHRLVGCFNDKSVVEYDALGNEVWRVEGLSGGPTSIERLASGNTLVACTEGSEVVEFGPDKQPVWRAQVAGRPVDARRLENGHTLVALQNAQKVVELDEKGKEVWQISGVGQPFSAQRLESGNTLVCALGHNKVREFDAAGRVVWEQGAFTTPYSAQRLSSGNTLVVDQTGLTEIDYQGTVVWRHAMQNVSRAWRY